MKTTEQTQSGALLEFTIEHLRFALPLSAIERVVSAVEVTPLPDAAAPVLGVINVAGRVLAVLDGRQRLGIPTRELELDDQFIIARGGGRTVALVVDAVHGILEQAEMLNGSQIEPGVRCVAGMVRHADGLTHLLNPDIVLATEAEALPGLPRGSPDSERIPA